MDAKAHAGELGEDPQGQELERRDVARVDIVLVGDGEVFGRPWERVWDEAGTRRGACRLLTMTTSQSTDGAVWCQAVLGPYWALYTQVHKYSRDEAAGENELRQQAAEAVAAAAALARKRSCGNTMEQRSEACLSERPGARQGPVRSRLDVLG